MSNIAGIYLNLTTKKMVRVQAMPKAPEGPDGVKVSDDANAGVKTVREIARARGLVPDPEAIQWDIDLEAIRRAARAHRTTEPSEEAAEWPRVA